MLSGHIVSPRKYFQLRLTFNTDLLWNRAGFRAHLTFLPPSTNCLMSPRKNGAYLTNSCVYPDTVNTSTVNVKVTWVIPRKHSYGLAYVPNSLLNCCLYVNNTYIAHFIDLLTLSLRYMKERLSGHGQSFSRIMNICFSSGWVMVGVIIIGLQNWNEILWALDDEQKR